MIYDFYSFGGEAGEPLEIENFEKDKDWSWRLLKARQIILPLKEYQGTTIFFSAERQKRLEYYCALRSEMKNDGKYMGTWKFFEEDEDKENKLHIDKLNIPSQDPKIIIVLDYHVFGRYGEKSKPLRLIETCSRWNEEFDSQIYICAYVDPLSDNHAKLLARFDDPAFQRVFEGLFVVPVTTRRRTIVPDEVLSSIERDEDMPFIYIDRPEGHGSWDRLLLSHKDRVGTTEEYIRKRLEVNSEESSEED
uniref:Uncharacterized protein n=1 Tax=Marseillevirus LCMAC101 TaxID=2506602 RepID=A0A481YRI9_9VIRU|nr:MAG: hypothetical protein LCMAC101_04780 [Marseillevirus LCMAC101]